MLTTARLLRHRQTKGRQQIGSAYGMRIPVFYSTHFSCDPGRSIQHRPVYGITFAQRILERARIYKAFDVG